MPASSLKTQVDDLWKNFWTSGITNGFVAIEQITYLFFMKYLDVQDARHQDIGGTTESLFSGRFTPPGYQASVDKATLRWSHFKQMWPGELLLHIQNEVFPFLKQLPPSAGAFARHMASAVFLISDAELLQGAVARTEALFGEIERQASESQRPSKDIQGEVYEMLLGKIASSAGNNGQFRTPRHIVKLMTELVAPQFGQSICDPACGTAGFLLDASQYIATRYAREASKQAPPPDVDGFARVGVGTLPPATADRLEKTLHGYDFDLGMVRLALMNLMLHGMDRARIHHQDTLSKSFNEPATYDVVLADPPFTGTIDSAHLNKDLIKLRTSRTGLLFTERIYTLLRDGGTAGIIIPQGVLVGTSSVFVAAREKLVEEAELKGVISLPVGAFKPYAAAATAILIFSRTGRTERTWFYQVESDDLSAASQGKTPTGHRLPEVVTAWEARHNEQTDARHGKCFFVPVQELRQRRYNLSFETYRQARSGESNPEKPRAILQRLRELDAQVQQGLAELEKILG